MSDTLRMQLESLDLSEQSLLDDLLDQHQQFLQDLCNKGWLMFAKASPRGAFPFRLYFQSGRQHWIFEYSTTFGWSRL